MIRSLVVSKKSRWRRVAVLALPAVLAGSAVGATQAAAQPAAHHDSVRATAAATAILDGFRHHRIVAFGMAHGLRQQEDFAIGLLRHPRFAATVDSIVVEFGNARFQALADRFVAGGDVSPKALRPVWRDAIGAAPDGVADESPARFFAAVRRLNQTLPPRRCVRVALGDPAFDFRTLRRRHDMDTALGRRDRVFAAVTEREARRGRHVLLLSGFMHLVRVAPELFGGENALRILERRVPGRVWVVLPYWGRRRAEPSRLRASLHHPLATDRRPRAHRTARGRARRPDPARVAAAAAGWRPARQPVPRPRAARD